MKINANGLGFNVVVEGEGQPVMLLHGFPDSSKLWRHQVPFLVENGFRVVVPDLRGFGESDAPEGVDSYGLLNVLQDITGILDELDIPSAHVVGHDFGAAAAWVLGSVFPDRVDKLVALSVGHPAGLRQAGPEQIQRSWYMFMFQFEGVAEELLTRNDWEFARQWVGGGADVENVIKDMSRPGRLTAALNWYRANIPPESWTSPAPELPPIKAPTTGVWSTDDIALTEVQMLASEEFVEGAWRYERIEGVGHWIPLEAPDRLNEILLDVFRG